MVRLHGELESKDKDARLTDVDQKTIDQAWKLVAAMKKEGIYTTISPYWAASLKHVPASWGIEGWPENHDAQGLLFFNPRLQEGYKAWLKALLDAAQPVHGHSPRPGPRAGDHPAPERGQHALLDHAERQGPAAPVPGRALRQMADEEVWLDRSRTSGLGRRQHARG